MVRGLIIYSILQDLAAINSREDILKYLDAAGAQQEATNPKLAKSLQVKRAMIMMKRKRMSKMMKVFDGIQSLY